MTNTERINWNLAQERTLLSVGVGLTFACLALIVPPDSLSQLFRVLALALASILAIVVSVGLISVQIAANQFTPLIGRLFEERQFLTNLILRFGGAILLLLIAMLVAPLLNPVSVRAEILAIVSTVVVISPVPSWTLDALILIIAPNVIITFIATSSAAYAFLSLLHIKNETLDYFNPEFVLDSLRDGVSYEKYQDYSKQVAENEEPLRNPVIEIYTIGNQAIEDGRNHTADYAIIKLKQVTMDIIEGYGDIPEETRRDSSIKHIYLFQYWVQLVKSSTEHGMISALGYIDESIELFGYSAARHDLDSVMKNVSGSLLILCDEAYSEQYLEYTPHKTYMTLLKSTWRYERWSMTTRVIDDICDLVFKLIQKANTPEVADGLEEITDELLGYVGTTMFEFMHRDGGTEQTLYDEFGNDFEKNIGQLVYRCHDNELACPTKADEVILSAALDAASIDKQHNVERLTKMVIEHWVVFEHRDEQIPRKIAQIIKQGGRDGVNEAFDEILDYEHVPNFDPSKRRKRGAIPRHIYTSVSSAGYVNTAPDFPQEVIKLRDRVEEQSKNSSD